MICDGSYKPAVLSTPPRVGGDCATCGEHFDTLAGIGVVVPGHSPMFREARERRIRSEDRRRADPDRYRRLRLRGGTPSDKRAWWGPTAGGRRITDHNAPEVGTVRGYALRRMVRGG
jgi:hypothetical protein